jgi:hypothetical protein
MPDITNNITISQPSIVINNTNNTDKNKFIPIEAPTRRPPTPSPIITYSPKAIYPKDLVKEPSVEPPQWGELNKTEDSHTLHKVKLDIDVKDLVNKIMKCVRVQAGDMSVIPSLINDLHIHIDGFYSSEKSEDLIFKKISQSAELEFIKVELKKEKKSAIWGKCFNGNSEKVYYKCCSVKPLNTAAEYVCYEYMNKEVHKMLDE